MIILFVCLAVCVLGYLICYIVLKFVFSEKKEILDRKTTIMASNGYMYIHCSFETYSCVYLRYILTQCCNSCTYSSGSQFVSSAQALYWHKEEVHNTIKYTDQSVPHTDRKYRNVGIKYIDWFTEMLAAHLMS